MAESQQLDRILELVERNSSDIQTLTTTVGKNSADIQTLTTTVGKNSADIEKLTGTVDKLAVRSSAIAPISRRSRPLSLASPPLSKKALRLLPRISLISTTSSITSTKRLTAIIPNFAANFLDWNIVSIRRPTTDKIRNSPPVLPILKSRTSAFLVLR